MPLNFGSLFCLLNSLNIDPIIADIIKPPKGRTSVNSAKG